MGARDHDIAEMAIILGDHDVRSIKQRCEIDGGAFSNHFDRVYLVGSGGCPSITHPARRMFHAGNLIDHTRDFAHGLMYYYHSPLVTSAGVSPRGDFHVSHITIVRLTFLNSSWMLRLSSLLRQRWRLRNEAE